MNLVILTVLLALWADKLELIFNELVRPIEFLKVLGITAISLVGVRLLLFYARRKNINSTSFGIKGAIVITLITSSYLYANYIQKLIHVAINDELRKSIAGKIKPANRLTNGTMANNLSLKSSYILSNSAISSKNALALITPFHSQPLNKFLNHFLCMFL